MVPPNSSDAQLSDSADRDSDELERMRLWVDNADWDVFNHAPDVERDIHWAMQLLQDGKITKSLRYPSLPQENEVHTLTPNIPEEPSDAYSLVVADGIDGDSLPAVSVSIESDSAHCHRFSEPKFLGAGAFGVVFRVHDDSLGIDVSIKLLRPSRSNSLQLRRRFLAEAQATARLSHPGIVRIYETGQIGPVPYISAACADGGSLAEFLARSKPTPRQSAWLLLKIADAVHHAHSHAVLHRDLKPSNILLSKTSPDGSEGLEFETLITDFGLAKRMDAKSPSLAQTSYGSLLGTLRYASPEQVRGAIDEIDTTSDVFSLGIILYEMLVGKVPFDSPNESNAAKLFNTEVATRPRVADPNIPRDLEAITLKCLAQAKKDRYQTAHELWLDLQRYLNGKPVEAQPSTFLTRLRYAVRTHPILTMVTTLTIFVNLMALFGLYTAWTRERTALRVEQVAREQERKAKEQERIAKERERDVLVGIVSIFSELGDLIQSGSKIKDEQWLTLLERSSQFLSSHCSDNPEDESMLHRLSVLKHYLSSTYQILGRHDDSWRERIAVDEMLSKLVESNPSNKQYLYQCFFSRLLIGSRLVGDPAFQAANPEINSGQVLDQALEQIGQLVIMDPNKIDYRDAMAATEITAAISCLALDPNRAKSLVDHAIEISKELWQENPDRPLLIKHAIRGLTKKAQIHSAGREMLQARIAGQEAVRLFETAWRTQLDERWAVLEAIVVYEAWVDVLIANQDYEEALDALAECDRLRELYDQLFPIVLESWLGKLSDDSKRIRVYTALHYEAKRLEVEERMLSRVESAKDIPGVIERFRQLNCELKFPASVSARIQALLSGK
jgi:serine/threonine protein kinase